MNVLLTSAGRRNYLVSYFRQALHGKGQVFAADSDPTAPALEHADRAFVVPKFSDKGYFDFLGELCGRYDVGLLISLNDLELPLLAREKARFEDLGVTVAISRPELVDACLDKWATFKMLSEVRIDTPLTFNSLANALDALERGILRFPVIVKPRWGTGSIGIEVVRSREELEWAYKLLVRKLNNTILADISRRDIEHAILIQEFVKGTEYGLDVINDLTGEYVCTFVKKKLAMRAGETDKAVTVDFPELEALGRRLAHLSKHVAIMDCDVLVTPDGRVTVLELNPRFGGGYPFSHVAGADIPAAILAWAEGRQPDPSWFRVRPGVAAAKYDMLAVVDLKT